MSRVVQNIYIDIESLLDIRQGFLSLGARDNEVLINYLLSDEYMLRFTDQFPFDEDELFFKLRDEGNRKLLLNAQLSYMIIIINRELRGIGIKASVDGKVNDKGFIINTYPFSFSQEELDMMRDAIFQHSGEEVFINFCYEPPENINVFFIESNGIETLFIYRFDEWMNANTDGLMTGQLNNRSFYFPEIVRNYVLDERIMEALEELKKHGLEDQFEVNRLLLSPFMNIDFVPIMFYSSYVLAKAYLETNSLREEELLSRGSVGETNIKEELANE